MAIDRPRGDHRVERENAPSLKQWKHGPDKFAQKNRNVVIDCSWGRLIMGHTFETNEAIARTLLDESTGSRDIAIYIGDPHVVLALAPQDVFLDPSHTFRMYLEQYRSQPRQTVGFEIRKLQSHSEAVGMRDLYKRRKMVPPDPDFVWEKRADRVYTYLVAVDGTSGEIIGTVTGIDHAEAFSDPENGCSLWALAVDPRTEHPGVGRSLVTQLLEHYIARGRAFLDLSVMHDNEQAIRLYEKLGFQRVPVFCVKKKNPINEPLFTAPPSQDDDKLNPYARIIVDEARRRGIGVDITDGDLGYFALSFGGRTVVCRESLSELTTAVAMSRCDDKRVTLRLLRKANLRVPDQHVAGAREGNERFLETHGRIVVKPARGEQGHGISVDLRTMEEVNPAIEAAKVYSDTVLLEELVHGEDLRIIVIDYEVVAGAVRRPPQITGSGSHTIRELIEKQSRRRAAATGGESRIPLDAETERVVRKAGYSLDDKLEAGRTMTVRKTANLHTGGTIHDVTDQLHPRLVAAAQRAATVLNIPVVGLDFMVPSYEEPEYWIIEANERPGLANHEPQPTAERFVDLLFPQTGGVLA